jgi:divinyl chlorophyllide a 8-vinyl-reductase
MTQNEKRPAARGPLSPSRPSRVLVAGATGYIGRHVVRELVSRGHAVTSLIRRRAGTNQNMDPDTSRSILTGSQVRVCEVTDAEDLRRQGFRGESFDAIISCLATRNGGIADSWAVEYGANKNLLDAAPEAGVDNFVLLSAICVQRPLLAFQHAKLAFESKLREAGLRWSIVRPTAFFKSLAGQVPRIKAGKPYLIFGPGDGPACKPISENDVANHIVDCLQSQALHNQVLPIGGPGPAVSARERGEMLFELSGMSPRFRHLPLGMFDVAETVLGTAARVFARLEDKAEFARIGRYYATESMLALDPETGEYDADATPEYGLQTLRDFYSHVLEHGLEGQELGEQALF